MMKAKSLTAQLDELTGVLNRERWRPSSSDIDAGNHFVIADLEDKTSIKGNAAPGELIPGLTYRFFGNWRRSASKVWTDFQALLNSLKLNLIHGLEWSNTWLDMLPGESALESQVPHMTPLDRMRAKLSAQTRKEYRRLQLKDCQSRRHAKRQQSTYCKSYRS